MVIVAKVGTVIAVRKKIPKIQILTEAPENKKLKKRV
jgi:hypothetical protein